MPCRSLDLIALFRQLQPSLRVEHVAAKPCEIEEFRADTRLAEASLGDIPEMQLEGAALLRGALVYIWLEDRRFFNEPAIAAASARGSRGRAGPLVPMRALRPPSSFAPMAAHDPAPDTTSSAADPAPVAFRLVGLTKQVRAFVAAGFAPLGIHPGQDRLLGELWLEDGLSQSQLIERLGVEPPTVTVTVQRLERAGFIRREPDAANRRISRVHLTPAGRELEKPVRAILAEAEERLLADLSDSERRELAALLARAGKR